MLFQNYLIFGHIWSRRAKKMFRLCSLSHLSLLKPFELKENTGITEEQKETKPVAKSQQTKKIMESSTLRWQFKEILFGIEFLKAEWVNWNEMIHGTFNKIK